MKLKLYNLDRVNTMVGGLSQPHDRAVVYDLDTQDKNPLTGQDQPRPVFWGTLEQAHAFDAKAAA